MEKKLKICHIVYNSTPSLKTANGVSFVLYNTIIEQLRQNIYVNVLELGSSTLREQEIIIKDLLYNISWYKFKVLVQYLLSIRNDNLICIFHSVHIFPFIIVGYLLRIMGIPYLVVCHGGLSIHDLKQKRIKKYLFKIVFQKSWLLKARAINALSQSEKEEIIKYGINNKIICIPNGIDIALCQYNEGVNYLSTIYPLSKDKMKILFMGRLDIYHKGLDILLKGYSLVPKVERKNTNLFIIGPSKGNSIDILKALVDELHLNDEVIFINALHGIEKYNALNSADLFCQVSRYEGFSMMILEVLYCGIPTIVTECASIDNMISEKNAGFLVSPGTAEQIANAIINYINLNVSEKNKMKINARNILKEFSIKNIVQRQNTEYIRLL